MQNRFFLRLLRWIITLLLLFYVFYKTGLFRAEGRDKLLDLVVHANLKMMAIAIGIGVAGNFSSALKWWMLVRSRGIPFGLGRAFAYLMVGKFFNLVLPTSMGGDIVRIHELGQHTGRRAEAAASVFVERFSGMITLFFFAVMTVVLNLKTFHTPIIVMSLVFMVPFIGGLYWLIIAERPVHFIRRWLSKGPVMLHPISDKIWKLHAAVSTYRSDFAALFWAFFNSVVFYVIAVLNVWVGALVFDPSVELFNIFSAVPVLLIIMNLPISVGGLGLMEFAYAFTFQLVGYATPVGFSVALLMRFKTVIDAFIGSGIYLFLGKGRSLRNEIVSEAKDALSNNEDLVVTQER